MRAPSMRNLECRVLVLGYMLRIFIRSSRCLQDNRHIYIYFETLKAKYFDRILYFTKDTSFHYQSYLVFRNKKYASLLEMTGLRPEWKLMLQNIHYVLPTYAGYLYFKAFVKSAYYLLVLSIKMKAVLHTK